MWLGLFGLAAAQCTGEGLAPVPDTLSVAWVSKVGAQAGASRWLWVVPTSELRSYTAGAGLGRTLQWLGDRKRDADPRGRYKVVIFDVDRAALCRPAEGGPFGGVAACDERRTPDPDRTQGCGLAVDRATGQSSVAVFRAEWATLAANGFCVLPYERFSAGR